MKIVIVEDHLMFREAIRKACTKDFGYQVVGEADSGLVAVDLILKVKPDVVILDLMLPDLDGFSVTDRVLQKLTSVRILGLSGNLGDYTLFRVEKSGMHGFVDKNTNTLPVLKKALGMLAIGKTYFSPAFQAAKQARQANPRSFAKVLSETECHVLSLIGHGLGDDEIGQILNISRTTAQTHRSHILKKLHIDRTPKLMAFAIENGFSQPPWRPD